MVEIFGDRGADGNLLAIDYYRPGSNVALHWPAVVGETRFEDQYDPARESMQRRELVEIVVERRLLDAGGVAGFEKNASVRLRGKTYVLDETTSKFDEVLVTLGLVATPLVEMGSRRNAV